MTEPSCAFAMSYALGGSCSSSYSSPRRRFRRFFCGSTSASSRIRPSFDLLGRLGMEERAEEEFVDGRLETGQTHQRMRTMIDVGQAIVTHVLRAGPTEGRHELIGGLDGH